MLTSVLGLLTLIGRTNKNKLSMMAAPERSFHFIYTWSFILWVQGGVILRILYIVNTNNGSKKHRFNWLYKALSRQPADHSNISKSLRGTFYMLAVHTSLVRVIVSKLQGFLSVFDRVDLIGWKPDLIGLSQWHHSRPLISLNTFFHCEWCSFDIISV